MISTFTLMLIQIILVYFISINNNLTIMIKTLSILNILLLDVFYFYLLFKSTNKRLKI